MTRERPPMAKVSKKAKVKTKGRQGTVKKPVQRSEPLTRLVTPVDSFVRSTNIERDRAGSESLGTYIADASVLDTVHRVSASMESGGRAFSVTGPYGSGKSTLAVFLNGLVAPSADPDWKYAHRLLQGIAPAMSRQIVAGRKHLKAHRGGFVRCFVVSSREPVVVTVVRALEHGVKEHFGPKYSNRDFATASQLRRVCDDIRRTGKAGLSGTSHAGAVMEIIRDICAKTPIMIVIDEFGKNLEYFAESKSGDGDLFLLQTMAEAGAGKNGIALFMITMQHMAFEEYGVGISAAHRREWAKVQGRFDDIPFSNSAGQTRLLVGKALRVTNNLKRQRTVGKWARDHRRVLHNLGLDRDLSEEVLTSCYPLHPLALLVLPELCARYGQHERTLMSFVAGSGKNAVPAFIDNETWSGNKLPSMDIESLYDYFVSSHQSTSSASAANVTRLMEITSIIRDSYGLSRQAIKTLKTIGVLNLISTSGPLRASKGVIEYAIGTHIEEAIEELEAGSLITYRPYADEYRIWRGTDVDIQASIDVLSKHYSGVPLAHTLERIAPLDPVIAARHGIRTGTMRMFERRFFGQKEGEVDVSRQDYDGIVLYSTEKDGSLPRISTGTKPVILVRPASSTHEISGVALETASIMEMLESDESIKGDWVARRELWSRMSHGITTIESWLEHAYGNDAEWWLYNGTKPHRIDEAGGAAVSSAADIAYPGTPYIHNEMINRTKLSMQASRARLMLINAMIRDHTKKNLGIEGWGPERAMYEAVLKKTGLHKRNGKVWKIAAPTQDILAAWESVSKSIERSQKHRVNVGEVYAALQTPPIGGKGGMAPVLLSAALIIKSGDVALYEHGTYCPNIAPEVVERLLKNPTHFEIKHFASKTKLKANVIQNVGKELGIKNPSLLGIVSSLVKTLSGLPKYTKTTKMLEKHDLMVRNAILTATEPDVMLFEALPKALGLGLELSGRSASNRVVSEFAHNLAMSIKSIELFYPRTLKMLQSSLLKATQTKERQRLEAIAASLSKRTTAADPKMRTFLNAITTSTLETEDWIEYVAMIMTDAPMSEWNDDMYELFHANLQEIAGRFSRLVALNFEKTSKHMSTDPSLYRVTVTNQDGTENTNIASINKRQEKNVNEIVERMIDVIQKNRGERPQIVLALIASLAKKL